MMEEVMSDAIAQWPAMRDLIHHHERQRQIDMSNREAHAGLCSGLS